MNKEDIYYAGEHPDDVKKQMEVCCEEASYAALCADGHLGYSQPIGSVIAYKDKISVSGVGYDIGCGNTLLSFELLDKAIDLNGVGNQIKQDITFGVGKGDPLALRPDIDYLGDILDRKIWEEIPILKHLKDKAVKQFGSVGSGNHYINLFKEVTNFGEVFYSLGCHFGSRGFGHSIASHFLKEAGAKDDINAAPTLLDIHSDLGEQYLACMILAGEYATRSRLSVLEYILQEILHTEAHHLVNNHHNFSFKEEINGEEYQVVRKGCTPLKDGQISFVGSSMGEPSYVLMGVGSEQSEKLLHSTVHGAGRTISRHQAKKKFSREEMNEWLAKSNIILKGGDLDESPMAYKRMTEVLEAHKDSAKIVATLYPLLVCMA